MKRFKVLKILRLLAVAGIAMFFLASGSREVAAQTDQAVGTSEEEFEYNDRGNRDPMWALVDEFGNIKNYGEDLLIGDLDLQGIMYDQRTMGFAIINGEILKPNQMLGKFVVLEITPNRVTLKKGEQTFELHLNKGE